MNSTFISSALGKPWEYDADFANEVALLAFVQAPDTGMTQLLRCRAMPGIPDALAGWIEAPHTHAQATQVQADLTAWQKEFN